MLPYEEGLTLKVTPNAPVTSGETEVDSQKSLDPKQGQVSRGMDLGHHLHICIYSAITPQYLPQKDLKIIESHPMLGEVQYSDSCEQRWIQGPR